ncbi:hypothetical protein AB0J80_03640 [Actinoplanes sp. NPDC049548]|uniref:hypothetical protein n=1 Tax=Actinoplanes sp. NPDC049548 TaxID=3155152 RepID=UPI00342B75F6
MTLSLTTIIITSWSAFATMSVIAAAIWLRGRGRGTSRLFGRGFPSPVRLSPRKARPDSAALEQAHRLWLDGLAGKSGWDELSDTGRHHLPPELLKMSTYRLGPDRIARAKVPDQN